MRNKIIQLASLMQYQLYWDFYCAQYQLYWDFCCAIGLSLQPENFHKEVVPYTSCKLYLLQPGVYHSFNAVDEDSYPLLLTLMLRWRYFMRRFYMSC